MSLTKRVSKIEGKLTENNYTRIPKEDFDNLINNQVDSKVVEASEKLKEYVNGLINQEFQDINVFISDAKRTIFNDELEKLQKRIVNNSNHNRDEYNRIEDQLKTLLKRTEEAGEAELSITIIDELVKCYYINYKNNEISEIIMAYQDKFDLTVTTLANAAIAYANLYELDGSNVYKEMTLKYCLQAFNKNPVYGEPTSMELIIYMIDYIRAQNEDDKNTAFQYAQRLIDKINSGSSYYWANQTIRRLNIDKEVLFEQYIVKLFELLPDKMKIMQTRSDEYETKKHG